MTEAQTIPQWVSMLQHELYEADLSALHAQTELWKRFGDFPEFPQVEAEVYKDWFRDRYLDWKLIEFTLYIRPVLVLSGRVLGRVGIGSSKVRNPSTWTKNFMSFALLMIRYP